jgi:hypothetical protein
MDALPAGSYLAIADGVSSGAELDRAQQRYNAADATLHYQLRRPDELVSFFDGLALVEPGVVPCSRWRPDGAVGVPSGEAPAYCGVARKGPVA